MSAEKIPAAQATTAPSPTATATITITLGDLLPTGMGVADSKAGVIGRIAMFRNAASAAEDLIGHLIRFGFEITADGDYFEARTADSDELLTAVRYAVRISAPAELHWHVPGQDPQTLTIDQITD